MGLQWWMKSSLHRTPSLLLFLIGHATAHLRLNPSSIRFSHASLLFLFPNHSKPRTSRTTAYCHKSHCSSLLHLECMIQDTKVYNYMPSIVRNNNSFFLLLFIGTKEPTTCSLGVVVLSTLLGLSGRPGCCFLHS